MLKEEMEEFIKRESGVTLKAETASKLGEKNCLLEWNSKGLKSTVMNSNFGV